MTYISCKVNIDTEKMDKDTIKRLHQILYRDSRIIRDYINIIKENEELLVINKKVSDVELDKLTATTENRKVVKHDLKSKYPRISLNELKECRNDAKGMYNSYLALKRKGGKYPNVHRLVPRTIGYRRFKLDTDMMVLTIMDSMDTNPKMIRKGWFKAYHNTINIPIIMSNYHLERIDEGELKAVKIFYDNNQMKVALSIKVDVEQLPKKTTTKPIGVLGIDLGINIAASTVLINHKGRITEKKAFNVPEIAKNYDILENTLSNLMRSKEVRMLEKLINNLKGKIIQYRNITQFNPQNHLTSLNTILIELENISFNNLDTIVNESETLINDLQAVKGNLWKVINRFLSENSLSKHDRKKVTHSRKDLKLIVNIFKTLNLIKLIKSNYDRKTDGLYKKLRDLKNKRAKLKLEIDRQLINQMIIYIESLTQNYDLYVALGKLKNIRYLAMRGNGNKAHRKKIHRWTFSRVTSMLEHKLSLLGLKKRFLPVNEGWTSIMCHKCNNKGERPRQSYFICKNKSCGWKGNADTNGAINIAKKLILIFRLTQSVMNGKNGLGKYLPVKAKSTPKARKRSPRRKTTGKKPLTQWFQDDLSESAETQLPGAGHTNREVNSQQSKQVLGTKGSKMMATSGWDGKNA
ncbi:MAG: transposase [Candidatus Heimdallarchaeota archaeon]|nr:transposase [Candidatus Heimdallarchaeota archaeon]